MLSPQLHAAYAYMQASDRSNKMVTGNLDDLSPFLKTYNNPLFPDQSTNSLEEPERGDTLSARSPNPN